MSFAFRFVIRVETQRRLHEEIDRLEQAVVDQFMLNPKNVSASGMSGVLTNERLGCNMATEANIYRTNQQQKERLLQEHTVDGYLDRITARSKDLQMLYKDEDG